MAIKPRVEYRAQLRPLNLDDNASIVKKKINKTHYVNWANKTELTNYIDSLYVHPSSDTYLFIVCQCGNQFSYSNKTNVPSSNVTCNCGRKAIEYS